MSTWIIPIEGHQFDIEDLPQLLAGCPVEIVKRADAKYYLKLPVALAGSEPRIAKDKVLQYLAVINGAAVLLCDSYRPVELGDSLFAIDDNDRVTNTVLLADAGKIRLKGGHVNFYVNGIAQSDPRLGAALPFMNFAAQSTAANDVLVLVGRTVPSWSELYLVFELVQANGGDLMVEKGWIGRAEQSLFCRTANSYTALGPEARHGKDQHQPPASPMTYEQAKKAILLLATHWLQESVQKTGASVG
jgi:hypothetical protein